MIPPQELRKLSRERQLALDLVEKDYVLGWILFGVAKSSISRHIAFKGGTALSKVYFPSKWRLSEDLDFTILAGTDFDILVDALGSEIPSIVEEATGISMTLGKRPFRNPNYLQSRFQYSGPISRNNVKIEVSKEEFVGEVEEERVPQAFDYPEFRVSVYSLDNILAEKLRTLLQRGKVKDYYDVWKLLKVKRFSSREIRELFVRKCEGKGVRFTGVDQFFPPKLDETLGPHLKMGLTRLTAEPLPPLEQMLEELRANLGKLLG